jgi:hypothetical protein
VRNWKPERWDLEPSNKKDATKKNKEKEAEKQNAPASEDIQKFSDFIGSVSEPLDYDDVDEKDDDSKKQIWPDIPSSSSSDPKATTKAPAPAPAADDELKLKLKERQLKAFQMGIASGDKQIGVPAQDEDPKPQPIAAKQVGQF